MTTIDKINPNKYYSSLAVSKMGILPWASPFTFNKKLNDPEWRDTFKPLIEQHKWNKTYKIRGENIIKFLANLEKKGLVQK